MPPYPNLQGDRQHGRQSEKNAHTVIQPHASSSILQGGREGGITEQQKRTNQPRKTEFPLKFTTTSPPSSQALAVNTAQKKQSIPNPPPNPSNKHYNTEEGIPLPHPHPTARNHSRSGRKENKASCLSLALRMLCSICSSSDDCKAEVNYSVFSLPITRRLEVSFVPRSIPAGWYGGLWVWNVQVS